MLFVFPIPCRSIYFTFLVVVPEAPTDVFSAAPVDGIQPRPYLRRCRVRHLSQKRSVAGNGTPHGYRHTLETREWTGVRSRQTAKGNVLFDGVVPNISLRLCLNGSPRLYTSKKKHASENNRTGDSKRDASVWEKTSRSKIVQTFPPIRQRCRQRHHAVKRGWLGVL